MIVLGTVLLANAGLGLYLVLHSDTPAESDAPADLGRELSLLKPQPKGQQAAAAKGEATAGVPRTSEVPAAAAPSPADAAPPAATVAETPAVNVGCFYWGPFNSETDARKLLSELRRVGALDDSSGPRVNGTTVQQDPSFMIFVGPHPTLGAARTVRDELKERGSDANVVTQDDRLVVSTGVFSQRRFAAAQLSKLKEWGYEPKQTELIRTRRLYFLQADIPTDSLALIDSLAPSQSGAQLAANGAQEIADQTTALWPAGSCDIIASEYGIL